MIFSRYDICECGDYRHHHAQGWATCSICGDDPNAGSPAACRQLRIFQKMTPTWAAVR